jgi:hypothetical protein
VADLRSREFATSFNLKKIAPETYRTPIKAIHDDTISRVQTLNGIHISSYQISARGFESSGPPS